MCAGTGPGPEAFQTCLVWSSQQFHGEVLFVLPFTEKETEAQGSWVAGAGSDSPARLRIPPALPHSVLRPAWPQTLFSRELGSATAPCICISPSSEGISFVFECHYGRKRPLSEEAKRPSPQAGAGGLRERLSPGGSVEFHKGLKCKLDCQCRDSYTHPDQDHRDPGNQQLEKSSLY